MGSLSCTLILLAASSSAFLSVPGFLGSRGPKVAGVAYISSRKGSALASGMGIATNYTWKEEAFEIEVTVKVPPNTRAKDISFAATTRSIDLRLRQENDEATVLLDGSRKLRGRVEVDGTYWVISDPDNGDDDHRQVTVTIEKLIRTPRDDFEVFDYDWKGVYSNDTAEVSIRKYDEPETLDVREYAASLGVDIDNINMSMVDKSMFSSGINLSQSSLNELNKAGLIKEITRQADGKEYEVNEEGKQIPFSRLGDNVGEDELDQSTAAERPKIPFLDTNSPWHNAVPVQFDPATNKTYVQQKRNFTRAAFAGDSAKKRLEKQQQGVRNGQKDMGKDPIDLLTVKRMKEILKSQGLKVSGNKKELQDRLRSRVNSLLQGKQDSD